MALAKVEGPLSGLDRPGSPAVAEIGRMIVGVPKEIKSDEYRVAMLPVGALELTQAGHTVLFEAGAGQGSGIADAAYADCRRDDRAARPPRSGPRPS